MTSKRHTPRRLPPRKSKAPVAIYARFATASHDGGKIVATDTEGASRTTRRREGLELLLNYARAGLFSAVICESADRLARSPFCAINLLDKSEG
jgi:DNA invertase Pin-like site-specific DNA recombinase